MNRTFFLEEDSHLDAGDVQLRACAVGFAFVLVLASGGIALLVHHFPAIAAWFIENGGALLYTLKGIL